VPEAGSDTGQVEPGVVGASGVLGAVLEPGDGLALSPDPEPTPEVSPEAEPRLWSAEAPVSIAPGLSTEEKAPRPETFDASCLP
jgi:hypothetical protein